jgi:hypothetical protein
MARRAGGGTNVGSSQRMDEQDAGENVAMPGAQVAVKIPACLGTVGGAGRKPEVSPFAARREARRPTNLRRTSAVSSGRLCTRSLSRLQLRACATSSSSTVWALEHVQHVPKEENVLNPLRTRPAS